MIRVVASPDSFDVTPGYPVDLTLTVSNDGTASRSLTLRLVGLDPAWVTWPEALPVAESAPGPALALGAGESIEIPIRVTLPPGFPAGAQLIGIEAAIDGVARPALGSLQLSVADIDGVSLGMSPASFRGGRTGRFRLNVVNRGKTPIDLALTGRPAGDDEASLKFTFKPDAFTLRPDERVRVRGRVTGKRPIIGAPRIRPMTIVAQSNSAPLHADARFTQRPLLSRRVLRVAGVFIALSMWAGALVTAVRWTGDRREETAAEASTETGDTTTTTAPEIGPPVEVDTDGDGVPDMTMVDTDGDGVPDSELVDTDGDGVPDTPASQVEEGLPSGPVLSGQVTGVADRANITVTGRYVALASSLPADGGDAVAAAGIGDGRKGKLFAAGVTTVDTDDPTKAERSTVTDEQGFWKLAGVAEGNWELTFAKAGFTTRTLVVPVEEGVEIPPIEVAMAAGSGAVGGVASTADGPLGGATVTVTDGALTFTTTTPTEGNVGAWQLGGLSTPGTYLVSVAKRGFGTQTASVNLGPSGSNLDVNLTLVAGVGSIAGTISSSTTGDGLGGITVTAASETVTRSVTTLTDDPAGSYLLPQLPIPGSYTLTITGTGYVPQTQLIELTDNVTDVDFELESTTRTIVGTVEGPDGPLDAVGITVAQDKPIVKALSVADGGFEVNNLQPGTYTLTFERFGFKTTSTIVELGAKAVETVEVELEATSAADKAGDATVQGIVRSGTTGQPITGVSVAFQGKTAVSAEGGTFTLAGLAAGTGDLVLTHSQHQTLSRTVRLGVKATVQVDITMLPLAGLQGQVTDLTATPLAGVSVSVAAQSGTAAVSVPAATTDANGEYSIPQSFPTGSYIATFSKTGYGTQTREFDATAGSNTTADIQLVELGTITGGLQEPGGGVGGFLSLTDVTVTVHKLVNGAISGSPVFGPVERDANYTVTGLEAGDYRITASKEFTVGVPTVVTRDITGLKLREVRDGGIVMSRGAAAVEGQVYFATGTGRSGVNNATITAQIVTGYTILPTFPFVSPSLQNVSTTTVASGTLVDRDDDGAVDDAAPYDGYYVIDPQPISGSIANYTVTATGFTQRIQAITSPTSGGSGDIVLIPNPKDISGTIAVNPAVAGAEFVVTLTSDVLSAPITHVPNVTTGAGGTGTYSFNDLAPGTYTVTFDSLDGAGDADSLDDYHVGTDSITLSNTSPETNDLGTTTVDRTSSIEIVVRTNNGTGDLVSGASVTLTALSGDSFSQTKTTNSSGEALFESLKARTYRVTVSRTGFDTATSAAAATATMIADIAVDVAEDLVDGDAPVVTLQRHPDVTINVTGRRTNIAPDGPTDTNILNATVTLTPVGGGTPINLIHSSGGAYTASQVDPALDYTLNISAPSHDSLTPEVLALSAGPNVSANRQLSRFASLVVYLEKTIGATTDPYSDANHSDAPATITAVPTLGGSTITLTKCAAAPDNVLPCPGTAGTWVANNVPSGTYTVTASASGYSSDTIEIEDVTAGATFTNDDELALTRFATLTVNVKKGVAATSATSVTATKSDGTVIPMASTGAVGEYRVTSIATGTYTITVTKTDHVTATVTGVQVDSGDSEVVDVTVVDLPDATVRVTRASDSSVITDANVFAVPSNGGPNITFTIDDNGTVGDTSDDFYEATKVPTGSYTLSVSASGFATDTSVTFQSTTPGGAITPAVLAVSLSVASSITVTVRDPSSNLIDDAMVVIRAIGGTNPTSRVRFTGDDGSGVAEFDEMTAGITYRVTVTKAGYQTYQTNDAVAPLDFTLSTGTNHPHNVTLSPLSIVTFQVTGSPGGAAVTGATVTATQGTTQLTAVPLFSGSYVFPGLPSGAWTFAVVAPNHGAYPLSTGTTYTTAVLDSTDGDNDPDGDIVAGSNRTYAISLAKWPTQTVTVEGGLTGSTDPLSGAIVTAIPTDGGAGIAFTETATAGTYVSPPLSPLADPETYTLTASKVGYTLDAPVTGIDPAAGVALGSQALTLLTNPTLTVDVESGFLLPANTTNAENNATVTLTPTAGPGAAVTLTRTTNAGEYVSPPLVDGTTYTLTATLAGHSVQAPVTGIEANAGDALTDESLVLLEHPTQRIEVERRANNTTTDFSGATVTATRDDGPTYLLSETGTVGTYVSPALEPGAAYTIAATNGTDVLFLVRTTAAVQAGTALTDIVSPNALLLQALPSLTVTVQGGFDNPAPLDPTDAGGSGATVTAIPTSGGATITLAEGATGSYSATGLPVATYDIRVTKAGHADTLFEDGFSSSLGGANGTVGPRILLRYPDVTLDVDTLGGTAVEDAVVTLTPATSGGSAVVLGESNATPGRYATTAVPPVTGDYRLRIIKDGYVTIDEAFAVTAGTAIADPVARTLLPNPMVTISVTSSDGGVDIDDATVTATDTSTGAVFTMVSIDGGDYRAQLPPAEYEFRATAPNHGEATDTFTVPSNDADAQVDADPLVLPRFGTVTVVVQTSFDADGAGAGPAVVGPLPGASVIATNTTTGLQYTVPDVNNDGTHILLDAPEGNYIVSATAAGHDSDEDTTPDDVSTSSDASFTLTLLEHPDLTVNVLGGLVADPPDEAGGSGATVTLTPLDDNGPTITIVETGDPGVHTLVPVAPGAYRVTATKAGYRSDSEDIDVDAGVGLDEVDLELLLNPTVTVALENDGGDDISDAVVTLVLDGSGAVVGLGETGTAGTYAATGVTPGDYTLQVQADGYTTHVDDTIVVNPGVHLTIPTVELAAAASLDVTVQSWVDGAGPGLDGATVVATNDDTGEAFVLGQDPDVDLGTYRTANLPAGSYTVRATAPGHETQSIAVTGNPLAPGETGTATIGLLRHPTLTVTVADDDGGDVFDALLTAPPVGGGAVVTLGETATAGTYEAVLVPGVDYLVTASKDGYTSDDATATDVDAGTSPAVIDLVLVDATVVTVTVHSALTVGGSPTLADLTTASVELELAAGGGTIELFHQHDGVYQRTVSVTGEYVINVSADGHTSITDDNSAANFDLTVGGPDISRTVDLPAEDGTVSGTVTGLGGALDFLADVAVSARSGATVVDAVADTDVNGAYSIPGLAPGVWSVTFEHEDLAPLTIAAVAVPFGADPDDGATVDLDVTLAPMGGAIMGQILGKASAEDVSAGNPATPLDGVTVTLEKGGTPIREAVTIDGDTGGWFGFGSLDADDDYELVLTNVPAGYTGSTTIAVEVTGGGIVTVSHTLVAPAVTLHVFARDQIDGSAIDDVSFTLSNPALGVSSTLVTGSGAFADGTATFSVPYGTYTLTVAATPDGFTSVDPSSRTVIVNNSGTATNLNHDFAAAASVTGHVQENPGTGVVDSDGATVTLTKGGFSTQTTTAADGTFSFDAVPTGDDYTVTATKTDYTIATDADVDVVVGTETDVGTLTITELATITVNVTDGTDPLTALTIDLFEADGTTHLTNHLGTNFAAATNVSTADFEDIVGGTSFRVRATANGHLQVAEASDLTVDIGEDLVVTVELLETGVVDITVNGLDDGATESATVELSWTRLGVAEDTGALGDPFTETATTAQATGLPLTLEITAAITDGGAGCTITVNPDGDADATFTLEDADPAVLTYDCT